MSVARTAQCRPAVLAPRARHEAPLGTFGTHLRAQNFEIDHLGRRVVGFAVAMNHANLRGDGERDLKKFVKLFEMYFGLSNREQVVFLRPEVEEVSTDEDAPPPRPDVRRPTQPPDLRRRIRRTLARPPPPL